MAVKMGYLSQAALAGMGFKRLGRNLKISDRAAIYNADQIEIGDCSRIDDFSVISGRVTMGRNVHIAVHCTVAGGTPGIVLEDFCGLSYGGQIFTQSDDYSGAFLTGPTLPLRFRKEFKAA